MRKVNQTIIVYVTEEVYRAYYSYLTAKDLCIFLSPLPEEEINKVGEVDRSEIIHLQVRVPEWWASWFKSLHLDTRYKFAKIIENRLKQQGLI